MGNSMLKPLKTKAEYLTESMSGKLGKDFDKNKKEIKSLGLPFSKKVRNKLSGFLVRDTKAKEKQDN